MKQLLCQSKEQIEDAQHEIEVLLQLKGRSNIIELIDYGSSNSRQHNNLRQVLLLFPLYSRGTIWHMIEQTGESSPWPIQEQRAIKFLLETCRGLEGLHTVGLAHRDLKPHNIILSDDGVAIIMDLGSVTTARVEVRTRQQALNLEETAASKTSAPYRAPELTQVNSK